MLPRTIAALGLLTGLGLAPLAAGTPDDPAPFASADGRFKIRFPAEPNVTESTSGQTTVYKVLARPRPGVSFTVVYFDLPEAVPADQTKPMLKKLAAGIKGKVEAEKNVAVGKEKIPGREVVYTVGHASVRQLMLIDGKRVYQVLVAGPDKDVVTAADADTFLSSLELVR